MRVGSKSSRKKMVIAVIFALLTTPLAVAAQGTRVQPPKNGYSIAQDVELGRQAAAEYERVFPTLPEDGEADRYVESVGRRLVQAIPQEYQKSEFQFQFDVINARDINASALPGGPMYINRGLIESAETEGEMAGVMAHEISHVVLRHGTAQATKQQSAKFQLPAIGGAILGAIIGGNLGGIIAQGAQMGVGAYFLKYSREYETQADILGSQIMARAGYDPNDLANMFRIIESKGGGNGPEWLSSHPNPGNRYERISQEAARLTINRNAGGYNDNEFRRIQGVLSRMSPAPTMSDILKNAERNQQTQTPYPQDSRIEQRVEYPSNNYRNYRGANLFQLSIPDNWQQFEDQSSVTFAPRGAYGVTQGQSVFTHGTIVGAVNAGSNNLEQASDRYIGSLLQTNSYLQPQSRYSRGRISGRNSLSITLGGTSPVTGQVELVNIHTTMLQNGALFYVINVAPRNEFNRYQRAFNSIIRSISLNG